VVPKSLLDFFADIPEPRRGNGVRHKLEDKCIVTIDAMGTQKEIASTIIQGRGNYVQVKDNQRTLWEDIGYYLEQEVVSQPKKQ